MKNQTVQHTPGPWTRDGDFIRDSKRDYLIARVAWGDGALNTADACLIAAAPETLKALKALRAAVQGISGYWDEAVDTAMQQADHAIKHATP